MQIIQRRLPIPPTKHKKFVAYQIARVSCPWRRTTVCPSWLQCLRLDTLYRTLLSKLDRAQGKVLLMHCVFASVDFLNRWGCEKLLRRSLQCRLSTNKKMMKKREELLFSFLTTILQKLPSLLWLWPALAPVFSVCVVVAQNRVWQRWLPKYYYILFYYSILFFFTLIFLIYLCYYLLLKC